MIYVFSADAIGYHLPMPERLAANVGSLAPLQ